MSRTITAPGAELSLKIAETMRWLSADAVQAANSGHPGMAMGCADIAAVLLSRYLITDPDDDKWCNRDRFVLSAGHGSSLLYSMLCLSGYLPLEDFKKFRQLGSITPGHPELGCTKGVDFTTGPLGAGFAAGVGMALAEGILGEMFNTPKFEIVDHYTYVLMGDGCQQEGISQEAASLAGHLKLGTLIAIYDSNGIQIDGATGLSFTEDVKARYEALNWHVQEIDGHDHAQIAAALDAARAERGRPSLIIAKTVIGKGSPNKQGTNKCHGAALGAEEVLEGKKNANWPTDGFYIPEDVTAFFAARAGELRAVRKEWDETMAAFAGKHATLAKEFKRMVNGEMPLNWKRATPAFEADEKGMATRVSGGKALAAFGAAIPELLGGSADLADSNKTIISEGKYTDFIAPDMYLGRNIHFGVREHAMGQICNGLAAYGAFIPFCATFLVFSDYMRPAMRLAALSKLRTLFVFSHDSIYVGEDGPTHQPVEQLSAMRCIPNLHVFRPADANEAAWSYQYALGRTDGPTALVFTRQGVPTLDRTVFADARNTLKGGYILERDPEGLAEICLIATGSEVHLAVEVANILRESGRKVRVVSMPSLDVFKLQAESYRRTVLPMRIRKRCVIEAGVIDGWEGIIGDKGLFIGMDSFGTSGKADAVADHFGFTVDKILDKLAEADF